jgi:hypothetical protein
VLAADKIHGDDTPAQALAPDTGKAKTGGLLVYVRATARRPGGARGALPL